ncbi:hypothetical protein QYE76_031484 [Lolium multiflorum]|uniref:Uncharacterized protein n=1 Tax=Lolium multiflorum TaxID=4521 RepID=A0AAD8QTA4_LOLMU|nr:hypothetical protein QYE76_031484 [Lolium multiflorum]
MGNTIGGRRRRTARVMTVDGTTYKYRPPAAAAAALRDHPGHQLLESEDVRRLGVRARPLDDDAPLKPGRLYFLVALPRLARAPRRTWSGPLLHVGGAGERLEKLMLSSSTRRSASDVAAAMMAASPRCSSVEAAADGAVRLRMRLPKADVARLLEESRGDAAQAAERIMQLCVARDHCSAPATPLVPLPLPMPALASSDKKHAAAGGKKEKKARFEAVPDEIIWF